MAKSKALGGCFMALWQILLTAPLWFAVLYAILSNVDVPQWAWFCFYAYIPASLLGIVFAAFFGAAAAD